MPSEQVSCQHRDHSLAGMAGEGIHLFYQRCEPLNLTFLRMTALPRSSGKVLMTVLSTLPLTVIGRPWGGSIFPKFLESRDLYKEGD